MGKEDIYQKYIKRAQSYKNILDPETGFMRPKLNGGWLSPFDPTKVDWHLRKPIHGNIAFTCLTI